jgi:two-component system phosphate regulon sensor histidine kinase PhoR
VRGVSGMRLGGLAWSWLAAITLVMAAAVGACFLLFGNELERLRDAELTEQLHADARLLSAALESTGALARHDPSPTASMVHALRQEGVDAAIVAADGTVLVNTLSGTIGAAELLARPEVRQALESGWGWGTCVGLHGPRETRAVAVRTGSDTHEIGVVWLSRPRWTFPIQTRSLGRLVGLVALVAVGTVVGIGLAVRLRWTRLLRRLEKAAAALADGDLSARAEIGGADEFALVARALNRLVQRLRADRHTIESQRSTLQALLDQLQQGIVVADADGRILLINPAAVRLLGLKVAAGCSELVGKPVEECVPQYEFQRLLRSSGQQGQTKTDSEISLRIEGPDGPVYVLARACPVCLFEAAWPGQVSGRLLVLTDVTSLRRAVEVQTEFVANASHELRTPLSAIRAAVEALLELDLAKDAAAARQFLAIIDRQSMRLATLARDLLDLSQVQQSSGKTALGSVELGSFLEELDQRWADVARQAGLNWRIESHLPAGQKLLTSRRLLRLILDNLADNAIQFTPPGGLVQVLVSAADGSIEFCVRDTGCGIPEEEQSRVFERFYQVERARSGARRGSGLGLSIVRDAVTALGGTVRLASRVGEGTCVVVRLPLIADRSADGSVRPAADGNLKSA